MSPRPTIFISAVSKELKSSRLLVSTTLQFLGYEPVWQDIFGLEQGDLRAMLRQKIDGCNGVMQLVGRCYGAEPPKPDDQFGRVSYTQYEALYAKQRGKNVWYLFLNEDFPGELKETEPEELRELQAAYRRRLKSESQLYHPLSTTEALEASVLKLRDELKILREEQIKWIVTQKRWAAAIVFLLVILFGVMIWIRNELAAMKEEMASNRQVITRFASVVAKLRQEQPRQNIAEVEQRAYAELAGQQGKDPKLLQEQLPRSAQEWKNAPDATDYQRASADYVTKDYAAAEQLALVAASDAKKTTPPNLADAIQALKLAGYSADTRTNDVSYKYADALRHFREAESLTDHARDPAGWMQIQSYIGYLLNEQNEYAQARDVLAEVVQEREKLFGTNDSLVLASRNNLAYALENQGKYGKAEAEYRAVWTIRESILGATNVDTLRSRNNLANVLDEQGKYLEAEKEYAAVLTIREQVSGPADSETLGTRLNLSWCQILNRDFSDALSTAEMGLIQNPSYLSLEINRAHALLLLGRTQEAEAIYFKHDGQNIPELENKLWQQIVLDDFNEFQKKGLYLAEMNDIRKVFDSNKK